MAPHLARRLLLSACLLLVWRPRASAAAAAAAAAARRHSPLTSRPAPHRTAVDALAPRSRQTADADGALLDGDACRDDAACRAPRRCVDSNSTLTNVVAPCSASSDACVCVAHPRVCVSAADCDAGEQCVLDVGYPTCVSAAAVDRLQLPPAPSPPADARPPRFGLTGDLCAADDDCIGTRRCRPQRQSLSDDLGCAPMFLTCSCVGPRFTPCENPIDAEDAPEGAADRPSDECPGGELCQTVGGNPICYTAKVRAKAVREAMEKDPPPPALFAANEAAEDAVCIAARALAHLAPHQLLFARARVARVLCDAHHSCATPGHMVEFGGRVMMMRTYCARRGCTPRVMRVNSPRFRRAMRVRSNTRGLAFTALAARYATRAEEGLLSAAIRVGLL